MHLRPHDLRRHAATFASRSGVPVEIVSKVILRHANLFPTQRVSWESQRCGSHEVGRELIGLMIGNEGEVEKGLAHLKCVDIFWVRKVFSFVISS